jgi:tape measure domain-containing protein
MASIDKLVIEIDGNATGLTKALAQAQKNLTTFNTSLSQGNKAVNAFVGNLNKAGASASRLVASLNRIKATFTGLNTTINATARAFDKMGKSANAASGDIKAFATALNRAAQGFERITGASKGATAAINSLQRRVSALSTTMSTVNGNMRTFNRTIQTATSGAAKGGVVVNQYGNALKGAGSGAGNASNMFSKLNKANITLMEGFRRHVAQITALRTLTYQAIFWFSPLVYSIIKVNAQYEKQMQLLKNLSGQSSELGKMQWAQQTRQQLIGLANTNPFSLEQITESFVRMKVSGLDPLNGGLQTLMDSIAAFGGGNEELQRAGVALQQMVGKSAVSMEELRQQLGEHIPDAMSAMAQGMGMSMAQFYKAVQTGTVESTTAIHNMLKVLNQDHRGAAAAMMNTWQGLLARLGTAWQSFVSKIEHSDGRNTFIDTLKSKVQELMVFLNSPAGVNFAISVEQSLAAVVRAVANVIKWVYEWRVQIVEAAKIFAFMWGGKLVLGTALSFVRVFGGGLRTIIAIMGLFSSRATLAAGITVKLAGAIRSLAVTLGIASSAANAAAMGIGAIATRMLGAIGIALALAGAVWAIVRALNAQSDAQKNANLAKSAAEGKTWDGKDKQASERKRLLGLQDRAKAGGYYQQTGEGPPVWVQDSKAQQAKNWAEYNKGAHAYNLMNANTRNATVQMKNTEFSQAQPDPYAQTRSRFADLRSKIDPSDKSAGAKLHELRVKEDAALAQDAQRDIGRLQAMKKSNPSMAGAIDDLIQQRNQDKESYIAPFVDQKYIANPKKGKKEKKKKEKKDPLEGARSSFVESVVSTADLQHQYEDLMHGTSTEFDPEAARAEGERRASLLKTKEALQLAKDEEKARQEEIRKSIKVEQAIHDIQDKRLETEDQIHEGLEDLKTSYTSVTGEAERYRNTLEREYRKELEIVQARMATGKATADEIRQYVQLKDAINAAVRAKQAELVVEAAKDAKNANEDYYSKFRSPIQQADYESGKEYDRYNDALKNAIELTSKQQQADEDLAAARAELEGITRKETTADNDAIIISLNRRIAQDEETKAAIASIPYLQERLRILNEEQAVRHKFGGAGGPLFDWAKSAASDFNDLGASMGNVLTGAMDDFINSLANGKMAFKDFAQTVLKQLLLIIIRGLIAKAIMSALGLTFGGSGSFDTSSSMPVGLDTSVAGSVPGAFYHSGGIVGGSPTFSRNVNPALFSFAKRYHTGGIVGLSNGEVPIIAKKGEGVFTREQMEAMGTSNKGSNVQVNVINQTGVEADVKREDAKFDGEKWVETIILKKMTQPGPVRSGLLGMGNK